MADEVNPMRAGPLAQDIAHCRSCDTTIVFLRTSAGRLMPVNVIVSRAGRADGLRSPNAGELKYQHGVHESHFVTCPQAAKHRSREVKDGDG